jgi:hypothetical protein
VLPIGAWETLSLNVAGAREAVREVGAGDNSLLNLKVGTGISNDFATVTVSRVGVRGSPASIADVGEAPSGDQGRTEDELPFPI